MSGRTAGSGAGAGARDTAPEPGAGPVAGALELIRRLRQGELEPSSLSAEARRSCVECLTSEGCSVAEIAGVLKTTERTIARDRARIREANALRRDPALTDQMAGRLVTEADASIARLRRLSRDKDAPHAARVEAERACWAISRDLVASLQRLGHLPTAATVVQADLRVEAVPPREALDEELRELELVLTRSGLNDETLNAGLADLKDLSTRLALSEGIRAASEALRGAERGDIEAVGEQRELEVPGAGA